MMSFQTTTAGLTASFGALDAQIAHDPHGTRDAALHHLDSSNPAIRYASIYALSVTGDNDASLHALEPVLRSPNETERLLAAEACIRLKDTSALPVAIAAMSSSQSFEYWDPPMPSWRFARIVLLEATGQDMGLRKATTLAESTAAQPAWERWWTQNASTYRLPPPQPLP